MVHLLVTKDRIKEKVKEVREEIRCYQNNIEVRSTLIKNGQLVLSRTQTQKEFDRTMENFVRRFERMQEKSVFFSKIIIACKEQILRAVEMGMGKMCKLLHKHNEDDMQKIQILEIMLQETLDSIALIEENYRQTKKCLEDTTECKIEELELNKKQCRADEVEWGSQDSDHVKWIFEHEPLYRDSVVRRYQEHFPAEKLHDFLLRQFFVSASVETIKVRSKKRRSALDNHVSELTKNASPTPNIWRFWITFNVDDPGQELPQGYEQFLENLQSALHQKSYHDINPRMAYKKILQISRMTTHQRQTIKEVCAGEFKGWKIRKLGKKRRFFFIANEEKCYITFTLCPRKESYPDND